MLLEKTRLRVRRHRRADRLRRHPLRLCGRGLPIWDTRRGALARGPCDPCGGAPLWRPWLLSFGIAWTPWSAESSTDRRGQRRNVRTSRRSCGGRRSS